MDRPARDTFAHRCRRLCQPSKAASPQALGPIRLAVVASHLPLDHFVEDLVDDVVRLFSPRGSNAGGEI